MTVLGIMNAVTLGFTLRLLLILYGEWQDRTMLVKYTDVDYYVFTDAAQFMTKGLSPYLHPTYRYTPILAWMLQPNIYFLQVFGKLLFILFDVLSGYLIYSVLKSSGNSTERSNICTYLWLFNPIAATVSSRGNAESIMAFLVLITMKMLHEQKITMAGIFYGLSVHFKIYPVIYALPIYFYLDDGNKKLPANIGILRWMVQVLWPNKKRLIFITSSLTILCLCSGLCYHRYGWDFLHQTYLYHVTRKDIHHNFSVYFYMLYLTAESSYSTVVGLITFIPQLILLLVFSIRYHQNLPLCWFLNTFAFVTYNKVCTSQYFLWYLCLVPVMLPDLKMSLKKAAFIISSWFAGQGLWLGFAYLLEFEGWNTLIFLWMSGLIFFIINIYVMNVILQSYVEEGFETTDSESRFTRLKSFQYKKKIE